MPESKLRSFRLMALAEEIFRQSSIFYKVKHLIGTTLQFRGLVDYHGRKHGSIQADMVLEKELRVLYIWIYRKRD